MTANANRPRKAADPPAAAAEWGWRYHHLGIPTHRSRPGERYIPGLKMYVAGFESSPFGIEWMRFEPDSPVHSLIQEIPHLAFEVDDLEEALAGREVISPPGEPSPGVRVAMILSGGAPVELMEFTNTPAPDRE